MTTLLIDGDVLLYKATIISEMEFDWGDDVVTIHSDLGEVRTIVDGIVKSLCEAFETDEIKIALSSSRNFRHNIDQTYKQSRREKRKPVGFANAREWLRMEYKVIEVDGLEADDVLGVLATQKSLRGDCVVCTIDKDLQQIPGTYHNIDSHETKQISEAEGHRYHMLQTLTGDPVDGYSGCPGVGPVRANKILDEAEGDFWSAVVKTYEKAGLTESDALRQARLARILQLKDINPKTKEPILWNPTRCSASGAQRGSTAPAPTHTTANGASSVQRQRASTATTSSAQTAETQRKRAIKSSSPRTTRSGSSSPSPSSCATSSRSRSATSSSTSCATKTRTVSKTSAKRGATSR